MPERKPTFLRPAMKIWRSKLFLAKILMNVYHGGTAVSPYHQHLYFDNVVIAREYIGSIPGTVPILQEEKHVPLPLLLNLLLAQDAE